jgi:hypothetical protein
MSAELMRRLLSEAVEFVEREVEVMEDSFLDTDGNWDDDDAAAEVADARRWLSEARDALKVPS